MTQRLPDVLFKLYRPAAAVISITEDVGDRLLMAVFGRQDNPFGSDGTGRLR